MDRIHGQPVDVGVGGTQRYETFIKKLKSNKESSHSPTCLPMPRSITDVVESYSTLHPSHKGPKPGQNL